MSRRQRVVENLNQALLTIFEHFGDIVLLGEDVLDPYGGAFGATRGLSTQYSDRVFTTPISESGFVGVAGGLALSGRPAIVEIMFGDFIGLAFDAIVNFISKSVSMYGIEVDMPLVIRCTAGGHRGYGPTHSQTMQKFFIGVPHLSLYEVSPFHDNYPAISWMVEQKKPAILFEDKVLYTRLGCYGDDIDDLFHVSRHLETAPHHETAPVLVTSPEFEDSQVCLIGSGGVANACIDAMRDVFLEHEIETNLIVPFRLYPFDDAIVPLIGDSAKHVVVVEENTADGTWGDYICPKLRQAVPIGGRVVNVCSKASIIPSARHLEKDVLLSKERIANTIRELCENA